MRSCLLIDVGNTHTDFALTDGQRIGPVRTVRTAGLDGLPAAVRRHDFFVLASVVPTATRRLRRWLRGPGLEVSAAADLGIGIRYPRPAQIGADRLANAVGVSGLYGAPAIVVDFGTAVTFDIVNERREYVGGVIAPGVAAMTRYLHQQTALLPAIELAEPRRPIGKSTVEAMRIGAVVGYRGLIKEILTLLRRQPGLRRAVVVATGGYGELMARRLPAIRHVNPLLTLEGLRLIYRRVAS